MPYVSRILPMILLLSATVSAQESGETLYEHKCGICHAPQEFASAAIAQRLGEERAMLPARDDLSREMLETVTRNGFLGMPAITRGDVSDAEMRRIIGYLTDADSAGD